MTTDRAARLADHVAVVTGGSGGLGRSMCLTLAESGAAVAVNYFGHRERADAVVDTIRSAGGRAAAVAADVTDADAVAELVDTVEAQLGPIDVLVNGATGPQPMRHVTESSWQDYLDQLDFFVKAPLLLGQAVVGGMRERGHGRIVNVGSEVIARPDPGMGPYATAKAALLGMTRAWAREFGPDGITVNMVAPGFVPVERHDGLDDAFIDDYRDTVAMQRMGTPDDIAAVVAFLAAPESSFVTGQVVVANGGRTFGI